MNQSIKIYHVKGTRSIRVIWTCEELNVDYQLETIPRFDAEFKSSPSWRSKSPTGKVPVMEHGNLSIFESGAMVQYLLDKYGNGQLVPDHASADYAYYLQWFWFAEATFARPLGDIAQNTRIKPPDERIAAVIPDAEGRALLCLQAVEAQLAQSNYLVGSKFTAADIMMGYTLHLATGMGILNEEYARTMAYLDALKTRPGFQSALIA